MGKQQGMLGGYLGGLASCLHKLVKPCLEQCISLNEVVRGVCAGCTA
jgi:hypothetical protein